MAPDTNLPALPGEHHGAPADTPADADRLALEAAVAEAREGGPGIPHGQVRARMLEMVGEARQRIARLQQGAAKPSGG